MKLYNNFTNLIRAARYKANRTQKDVAKSMGLSYQQYQVYEHGRYIPQMKNRQKLATALGIDVEMINNAIYIDERLKTADRTNEKEYVGSPRLSNITEKIENYMTENEFFYNE